MGCRAVVVAQALLWLFEVAADDIQEFIGMHDVVRVERVEIVYSDQARSHVPPVIAAVFICRLYVSRRCVVRSEDQIVQLRILVSNRRVRIESQPLMVPDRKSNSFGKL